MQTIFIAFKNLLFFSENTPGFFPDTLSTAHLRASSERHVTADSWETERDSELPPPAAVDNR